MDDIIIQAGAIALDKSRNTLLSPQKRDRKLDAQHRRRYRAHIRYTQARTTGNAQKMKRAMNKMHDADRKIHSIVPPFGSVRDRKDVGIRERMTGRKNTMYEDGYAIGGIKKARFFPGSKIRIPSTMSYKNPKAAGEIVDILSPPWLKSGSKAGLYRVWRSNAAQRLRNMRAGAASEKRLGNIGDKWTQRYARTKKLQRENRVRKAKAVMGAVKRKPNKEKFSPENAHRFLQTELAQGMKKEQAMRRSGNPLFRKARVRSGRGGGMFLHRQEKRADKAIEAMKKHPVGSSKAKRAKNKFSDAEMKWTAQRYGFGKARTRSPLAAKKYQNRQLKRLSDMPRDAEQRQWWLFDSKYSDARDKINANAKNIRKAKRALMSVNGFCGIIR